MIENKFPGAKRSQRCIFTILGWSKNDLIVVWEQSRVGSPMLSMKTLSDVVCTSRMVDDFRLIMGLLNKIL